MKKIVPFMIVLSLLLVMPTKTAYAHVAPDNYLSTVMEKIDETFVADGYSPLDYPYYVLSYDKVDNRNDDAKTYMVMFSKVPIELMWANEQYNLVPNNAIYDFGIQFPLEETQVYYYSGGNATATYQDYIQLGTAHTDNDIRANCDVKHWYDKTLAFQQAPLFSNLTTIVRQAKPMGVLEETMRVLPIVMACLVGYLALRKALKALREVLQKA